MPRPRALRTRKKSRLTSAVTPASNERLYDRLKVAVTDGRIDAKGALHDEGRFRSGTTIGTEGHDVLFASSDARITISTHNAPDPRSGSSIIDQVTIAFDRDTFTVRDNDPKTWERSGVRNPTTMLHNGKPVDPEITDGFGGSWGLGNGQSATIGVLGASLYAHSKQPDGAAVDVSVHRHTANDHSMRGFDIDIVATGAHAGGDALDGVKTMQATLTALHRLVQADPRA